MREIPPPSERPSSVGAAAIDISSIFAPEPSPPPHFWQTFGFLAASDGTFTLPSNVVALEASDPDAQDAMIEMLKTMGVPSRLGIVTNDRRQAFYRVADPAILDSLAKVVPLGVKLLVDGCDVCLPAEWSPNDAHAATADDLSELTDLHVAELGKPSPDPVMASNPLLPYSLRGQSERFKRLAVEARPLLGDVCLRGQVTIWYAGPNTGKTLLALSLAIDAVRQGRIAAGNIYYINADDNGAGFATKLQIMDDLGANTLAPGFRGLRHTELSALLHKMADQDEARGVLIIIDTVKKFAHLMDKKESSAMAQAFRQVAMKGGSVLGLAHTTKNPNADGTPRYAGTSDLVDDADAVYTIRKLNRVGEPGEQMVEFNQVKARGDCADTAAYAFTSQAGVSYQEMLSSVRTVDPMKVDEFKRIEEQKSDADMTTIVTACISEGFNTKMVLIKEVAERANISGRAAGRLIDRYTGTDPIQHRWRFRIADRGAQIFEPLAPPPGES